MSKIAHRTITARQPLKQPLVTLPCQIKLPRSRRVFVADAVEAAFEAVEAGGVAVGVLVAVVAVVPVEDVEAAVGAGFWGDGHEPTVVGGEEVGLGGGEVGAAVAVELID